MITTILLLLAALILAYKAYVFFADKYVNLKDYSMQGKTVIVTGANTGIGLPTAKILYELGAHVIMACRSKERAMEAIATIEKMSKKSTGKLTFLPLDLASLDSVRQFAQEFQQLQIPLHILINNAGIADTLKVHAPLTSSTLPKDIDSMVHVNVVAHHLLVELLLPLLQKTQGRVVVLSSDAHLFVSASALPNSEPLLTWLTTSKNPNPGIMNSMKQYGFTKLCNMWQVRAWHHKYTKDTKVTFYGVHPGAIQTELGRNAPSYLSILIAPISMIFFKTADWGAQTSIHCALVAPIEQSGSYFANCGVAKMSDLASNTNRRDELYKLLCEWTGTN